MVLADPTNTWKVGRAATILDQTAAAAATTAAT